MGCTSLVLDGYYESDFHIECVIDALGNSMVDFCRFRTLKLRKIWFRPKPCPADFKACFLKPLERDLGLLTTTSMRIMWWSRELNVIAVIDWGSVVAVPDAALYCIPDLMWIDCPAPGIVETHPAVMEQLQRCRRFVEVVVVVGCEKARKNNEDSSKRSMYLFTKEELFSTEAVAFHSLLAVQMRQDWVYDNWVRSLQSLSEHNEMELAQFYLRDWMAFILRNWVMILNTHDLPTCSCWRSNFARISI